MERMLFQAQGSACAKCLRQEENLVGTGKEEDQCGLRVEKVGEEKPLPADETAGGAQGARQGRVTAGIWDNTMQSERS